MIIQPVQNKAQIYRILAGNQATLQRYGVKRIGLFGSFAREEQKSSSDIDFLVDFEPAKKKYSNFIGLTYFLEDKFHRTVEVVTPESLTHHLKPHIEKEVEYVFNYSN